MNEKKLKSRVRGCLLAGACGDALGAVTEFMSLSQIHESFGPEGITELAGSAPYVVEGGITDDTQMTLFTAEGLLRAQMRQNERGICHPPSVIHHAYLRWLISQGAESGAFGREELDGWLIKHEALHSRRAPGNTCLSALTAASALGELAQNNSKGCGGVMRVAPIAIAAVIKRAGAKWAFDLAVETTKLTHGHPSGYWSAGAFAAMLVHIFSGESIEEAARNVCFMLDVDSTMDETREAVVLALELASQPTLNTARDIARLGEGWVGEEALAIAVYCAITAKTLRDGVIFAANHDGDTDSTASIAGNLLGALNGEEAIPESWMSVLELRDVIGEVADDLLGIDRMTSAEWDKYPGW